jgi:tetratricopeptide (TPR) repeat protein
MNNNEELQQRRDDTRRKARFYLYAGYLILGIGVFFLYSYRTLGFILIAVGGIIRILYYIKKSDLKAFDKLDKHLRNFIVLIIPLTITFFPYSASALLPGDKADPLDSLIWLQGEPVKIFNENTEKQQIVIIECWATSDKGCLLSLPVLSSIQKKYKKDNVVIVGISKEKENVLKDFLKNNPKKISFHIAKDPSGHTSDRYTGNDARIPLVLIVGKNRKILWRGHPLELEPVLKKILSGTFDLKKQIKISELQKQLQTFLQIEDIKQAIRIADKILNLDPSNDIAMRVRLFVFESRKEIPQALEFINTQIRKNPNAAPLYFIKLDLLERTGATVELLHHAVEETFNQFKNDKETLHQLAWTTVNRMRFGTPPLATSLKASKRAIELLFEEKEQNPAQLAIFLSTRAKILYLIGAIEQAIKNQEKVILLQKGDPAEQESTQLLHYYQNALKIRKETTRQL